MPANSLRPQVVQVMAAHRERPLTTTEIYEHVAALVSWPSLSVIWEGRQTSTRSLPTEARETTPSSPSVQPTGCSAHADTREKALKHTKCRPWSRMSSRGFDVRTDRPVACKSESSSVRVG